MRLSTFFISRGFMVKCAYISLDDNCIRLFSILWLKREQMFTMVILSNICSAEAREQYEAEKRNRERGGAGMN